MYVYNLINNILVFKYIEITCYLMLCYETTIYFLSPASWARLGELNYLTYNDGTIHQDYKIVQRIIHPSYQPSRAKYNDLALFRLEKKVMFSEYVRPVCINTNQFLKTSSVIASGWGQTANG